MGRRKNEKDNEKDRVVVVVKSPIRAFVFSSRSEKEQVIPPGTHQLKRVPNPFGENLTPWLVLPGRKIGMGEEAWRTNGSVTITG